MLTWGGWHACDDPSAIFTIQRVNMIWLGWFARYCMLTVCLAHASSVFTDMLAYVTLQSSTTLATNLRLN